MKEFPFTTFEWRAVERATTAVTNATLLDDPVLREVAVQRLRRTLERLKRTHGRHPILTETWADFLQDAQQQRKLYRRAIKLAAKNSLPTWTIRLSLARLLLEQLNEADGALGELRKCAEEVSALADEYYQDEFRELLAAAQRA